MRLLWTRSNQNVTSSITCEKFQPVANFASGCLPSLRQNCRIKITIKCGKNTLKHYRLFRSRYSSSATRLNCKKKRNEHTGQYTDANPHTQLQRLPSKQSVKKQRLPRKIAGSSYRSAHGTLLFFLQFIRVAPDEYLVRNRL